MSELRNRVRLVDPGTGLPGHFDLNEFENGEGLTAVERTVLWSLERSREELNRLYGTSDDEIICVLTDGVRTPADLNALAARLGWTGEGGDVSRDSTHLVENGALGVDGYFRYRLSRKRLERSQVGPVVRLYFDWVKDDYADGHGHWDNRDGCRAWTQR